MKNAKIHWILSTEVCDSLVLVFNFPQFLLLMFQFEFANGLHANNSFLFRLFFFLLTLDAVMAVVTRFTSIQKNVF